MRKLADVAELQTECLESGCEKNNPGSKLGIGASLAAAALWYHSNYSTSYSAEKGLTVTERPCIIL